MSSSGGFSDGPAGGTDGVNPADYDLVCLAMQEPQFGAPGVRELLAEAPINEKRLYEDALSAAHHGDISEEMTRLRVHLKAMGPLLGRPGTVGKSIEFLLQEMGREINTIGAKSQDAQMSQIAVEMKGEIEKMREQVQNVE